MVVTFLLNKKTFFDQNKKQKNLSDTQDSKFKKEV